MAKEKKKTENELELFDALSGDIAVFVAPTLKVTVTDAATSQQAIEVAQRVKALQTQVENKRKELVGPLNERVKLINAYAKKISAPLDQAENHVRTQLNKFAAEQEVARQEALRKVEAERREAERLAQLERDRIEAELMAKQEAEANAHAEAASMFGSGSQAEIEAQNDAIDERQQREWAEQQAKFERERMARTVEASQKTYDASLDQVRNTRTTWKCKAVNLALIPKEFLIIEMNEKAVLAAKKAGVDVPGVEYWQEVSVAIGANTYMPKVRGAIRGE